MFEYELIPLFEKCGKIWDLRLMMDPSSGLNRGYGFVTFCDKEGANEAVNQVGSLATHLLHGLAINGGSQFIFPGEKKRFWILIIW